MAKTEEAECLPPQGELFHGPARPLQNGEANWEKNYFFLGRLEAYPTCQARVILLPGIAKSSRFGPRMLSGVFQAKGTGPAYCDERLGETPQGKYFGNSCRRDLPDT